MIKRLVIHCTATKEGRAVTPDELRRWHTEPKPKGNGWKQVGYTDMILLNGEVVRLVDNNEDTTVDPWEVTNGAKGYNSTSRHIVYVGGLAPDGKTPKDTRTSQQREAMELYVKDFHNRFPDVEICGHCDLSSKACPSFNVKKWLKEIGIN
ncbi:MAG: N-acetylmuramoyl-L-alanine amidase [Marinifilaceae bacterium]